MLVEVKAKEHDSFFTGYFLLSAMSRKSFQIPYYRARNRYSYISIDLKYCLNVCTSILLFSVMIKHLILNLLEIEHICWLGCE